MSQNIFGLYLRIEIRLGTIEGSPGELMGDEGSYLAKWEAAVFLNLQNHRDGV